MISRRNTYPIFILTSSLEATHQYHLNSVSQTIFVHFVTLCGAGTQPTTRIKAFCYLKQLLCHFYLLPLLIFLAIHSVAEYEFVFEIQGTTISNIFRNKSKLSALYIPLKNHHQILLPIYYSDIYKNLAIECLLLDGLVVECMAVVVFTVDQA